MMLMSIGDRVKPGAYSIHSRFSRVVNMASGENLVFVADETIGAGPLNLVFRGLDFSGVETLHVGRLGLRLGARRIAVDRTRRYDSRLPLKGARWDRFSANMDRWESLVLAEAHPKSLVFLLDPARESAFRGGFERAFVERIKTGVAALSAGHLEKAVDLLKGCGGGLTPSGDDFLAGFTTALHVLHTQHGRGVFHQDRRGSPQVRPPGRPLLEGGAPRRRRMCGYCPANHGLAELDPPTDADGRARMEGEAACPPEARRRRVLSRSLFDSQSKCPRAAATRGGRRELPVAARLLLCRTARSVCEKVGALARGDNVLSNAFLSMAALGRVFEPVRALLTALSGERAEAIATAARRVLAQGETSGADWSAGFLKAYRDWASASKPRAKTRLKLLPKGGTQTSIRVRVPPLGGSSLRPSGRKLNVGRE